MSPRLLDLFCGAGGAAMGYHRAGFDVIGVDLAPQPNYPFPFHRADAMSYPLDGFDVIHASPPCQGYTALRTAWNAGDHPLLIGPTRDRLLATGLPFVIENVPQSPIVVDAPSLFSPLSGVQLCGTMFGLNDDSLELRRHRRFESNIPLERLVCRHSHRTVVGFYGDHVRIREVTTGDHRWGKDIAGRDDKLAHGARFMGIDWMDWDELREAIPPAYTEWLGCQLLTHLGAVA